MTMTGRELVNRETGELISVEQSSGIPMPMVITAQYVQQAKQSLALLQDLTKNVLRRNRDYGRVPGIPSDFLWEPGAEIIISSFNCYVGQVNILRMEDTSEKIAIVVEVPLISYQTGRPMGYGVGAASTMEVKNKYRWIKSEEFDYYGITPEGATSLKQREKTYDNDKVTEYQIKNPDFEDLLNNLIKMAAKRAEVDAAERLPGVASALKEILDWKTKKAMEEAGDQKQSSPNQQNPSKEKKAGPDWNTFWAKTKQMGMESEQVHKMLGVKSMTEWTEHGFTLEQAIDTIAKKLAEKGISQQQQQISKTDPSTIKTFPQLYSATEADYHMSKAETLKEAGYSSEKDIAEKPQEIFERIKSMR
jgi:hypothetical protein